MLAGHGIEDVPAVQLPAGKQVQRGREQSHPRRAPHGMQQQISRSDLGAKQRDEQSHYQRLPEDDRSVQVGVRHAPRINNRNRQRRNREQESDHRARKANVKQRLAIVDWRTNTDKRPKRPDQRGRRKKVRIAGGDSVIAAGEKMSQFVGQQDTDQREGERGPGQQQLRMRQQGRVHRKQRVEIRRLPGGVGGRILSADRQRGNQGQDKKQNGD